MNKVKICAYQNSCPSNKTHRMQVSTKLLIILVAQMTFADDYLNVQSALCDLEQLMC